MDQITPLGCTDYEELSRFLAAFPGETLSGKFWLDRFAFWWENNPAFGKDFERGWVLRSDGQIAGFCGMIPSKFQLLEKDATVFSTTTWRVLPEHRSQSLQLLFKVITASRQSLLFCTTPGDITVSVLKALKFQLLPARSHRRSVVVTNAEHVIRTIFRNNRLAAALGKLTGGGVGRLQAAWSRCSDSHADGQSVRELTSIGPEFDELWNRTRKLYANTNVRTAETLAWYCFGNPAFGKKLFGLYRDGELQSYMMCRLNEGGRLRVFECLDLWPAPDGLQALGPLVSAAWAYAKTQQYDMCTFPHFNPAIGAGLKSLRLFQIRDRERRDYVKIGAAGVQMTDADSYFVGAQGDNGL